MESSEISGGQIGTQGEEGVGRRRRFLAEETMRNPALKREIRSLRAKKGTQKRGTCLGLYNE